MKILNKIWIFIAGATLLVSCTDLDTSPAGDVFTQKQKEEIYKKMASRVSAEITGMYALMSTQYTIFPSSERDDDFGYPMACLSADLNGSDMVSTNDSYNWFSTCNTFEDRTYTYANPMIRWALFYKQIKAANDILATIPVDASETLLQYRGQALAVRAFAYMNLVYRYQFTYVGNESLPAIPIVTEIPLANPTSNPRATVQQVYDLIMSDLNSAIGLLDGYSRSDKASINKEVAFGLRARANLVMGNWADAAADADSALVGTTLLTKKDVSTPGFNSADASSWMWALIIRPVNIKGVYANWPSKLSSFAGNSYTANVGCYKMINNLLWNKIPATDVRKGWWVSSSLKSPLIDSLSWPGYPGEAIGPLVIPDVKMAFLPYTNVKFNAYKSEFGNGENASDWCIMRAEEMVLIKAEGLAMSAHEAEAKTVLEDFVKTYRDNSYVCTAATAEALQNEIWYQRRVELWGEGFAFWDIMRLKKNIVRFNSSVTSNFPAAFKFNMSSTDGWLLMRIPQKETSANSAIPENANNNEGTMPVSGQNPTLTDGVND